MVRIIYNLCQQTLSAMTRGVDKHGVLVQSLALAGAAAFCSVIYFHYMLFIVPAPAGSQAGPNLWNLLLAELLVLFIICFLAAMVGLALAKKYELPGWGDLKEFARSLPLVVTLGIFTVILSYGLFDRYFYAVSPYCYPQDWVYLAGLPLQGAVTDETILRLGLVTIGVGLFKSKISGVVCVSAIASLFTIKYLNFFGVKPGGDYLFVTQMVLSFVSNCLLGYLFVTRGLLCSMTLKFLFGLKYVVVFGAAGAGWV